MQRSAVLFLVCALVAGACTGLLDERWVGLLGASEGENVVIDKDGGVVARAVGGVGAVLRVVEEGVAIFILGVALVVPAGTDSRDDCFGSG